MNAHGKMAGAFVIAKLGGDARSPPPKLDVELPN
jgi:hypothetical protein